MVPDPSRAATIAQATLNLRRIPTPDAPREQVWHALILQQRAANAERLLRRADPHHPHLNALRCLQGDMTLRHADLWAHLTPDDQRDFLLITDAGRAVTLTPHWTLTFSSYTLPGALLILGVGLLLYATLRHPDTFILAALSAATFTLTETTCRTILIRDAARRLGGQYAPHHTRTGRFVHPQVLSLTRLTSTP